MLPAAAEQCVLLRCAAISPVVNEPLAHEEQYSEVLGRASLGFELCRSACWAVQPLADRLFPSNSRFQRARYKAPANCGLWKLGGVWGARVELFARQQKAKPRGAAVYSTSQAHLERVLQRATLHVGSWCDRAGPSRWPPKELPWWHQGSTSGTATNSLLSTGPAVG